MGGDYLGFFNLSEDPFRMPPDPHYFYPSELHNELLSSLNYAIEQKEGFFLATGEPGTGKTTVLKVFIDNWKDRAEIALIMTPNLSPGEFLSAVLEDLDVQARTAGKHDVLRAFRDFLVETALSGKRVIVIVDEAQNIPDDTLEELRLLSNLETEKEKLLQIVLIGQPELRDRVLLPSLKQLNQRISVRASLAPLSLDETSDYLLYRLMKAGAQAAIFDDSAKKRLYEYSGGVPRLINLTASRALMAAFVSGSRLIRAKHVEHAVRHLEDAPRRAAGLSMKTAAAAAMVIVFLLAAAAGVKYAGPSLSGTPPQAERGSPTAQQSAEALPVGEDSIVVPGGRANLRKEPHTEAPIVFTARRGERYLIAGQVAEQRTGRVWYKVRTGDGQFLWVSSSVVIKVIEPGRP